jgi:hypothetical protein
VLPSASLVANCKGQLGFVRAATVRAGVV